MSDFPIPVTMAEDNKCVNCGGKCCTYITTTIPSPDDVEDFDHLMWQVAHEHIQVYHDGNDWTMGVVGAKCSYLGEDGYCNNYDNRFFICRDYSNETCGGGQELSDQHIIHFNNPEDVNEYATKRFGALWTNRYEDHAAGKYGNVMDSGDDCEELSDEQSVDRLTALELRVDDIGEALGDLIDALEDSDEDSDT